MTTLIGRLAVALQLETAAFERGSKRASAEVNALGDKFEKAGDRVGRMSKAIVAGGALLAGSAIVGQLKDLVTQGLEYASSLGETAQQLGVTAKSLQEYRYAATQAGISQEQMDGSLAQLSKRLGQAATGSKAQAAAFANLGINIRDAGGHVRDAGELIPEIAEALSKMGSDAERSAAAVALFGKSGQAMLPFLEGGAKGVNDLRKAANDLGIVMSDSLINKADAAADKMSELGTVLKTKLAVFVAENSDAIFDLATKMESLISKILELINKLGQLSNSPGGKFLKYLLTDYGSNKTDITLPNLIRSGFNVIETGSSSGVPARVAASAAAGGGTPYLSGLRKPTNTGTSVSAFLKGGAISPYLRGNLAAANDGGFTPGQAIPGALDAISGGLERAARGFTEMGSAASSAGSMASAAMIRLVGSADEVASRAQGLVDRLFPDEARLREYGENIALLSDYWRDGAISADKLAEAQRRLTLELIPDDLVARLSGFGDKAEATAQRTNRSFKDMADGVVSSLDRVAQSVRGGGFLDILSSVIGLGLQLGSAGLFGKTIAANINVPKYAGGTNFHPGGLALVGERGPELVNLPRGSQVAPNGKGWGGGGTTINYYGPGAEEFWGRINAGHGAAAQAGADLAAKRIGWQQTRRVA